jgi:beta-lactamase class D
MRFTTSLLLLLLCFACKQNNSNPPTIQKQANKPTKKNIIKTAFQSILDSAQLKGSILIYDAQEATYYSNDFEWAKQGQLPASTFKIPNSIIALETGVVENDSTLFKWDGNQRNLAIWEQDLIFKDAFHFSCVPCYQEVARKIGVASMQSYLQQLNYGAIDVDATTIHNFWLQGSSKINQMQQIDFLQRFFQSELPISKRTEELMKKMMIMEKTPDYQLSGKTGWSISNDINNGWFVGYLETQNKVYYFAANVAPTASLNMRLFPTIRKEVVFKTLQELKLYPPKNS